MSFLCDSIYFITVFLFGTVASVCFTGVSFNRKNILTLSVFCALDGILQIISFAVFGQEISRGLYPVVVHLPLVLFLWLIYKCSWITSIVSVLTAYMCCQIPLWCGLAVRLFSDNKIIYTIVYVGCAFVTFYFLYHYESNLAQHFMPKANKSVYILGILPLCYYLFDYASTIYTDMLYTSNEFVVQFMPSICCIFYFVFIFYYYHKLEEQEQAERLAESLHMQLTHAAIDLNHMRTMQTQAASYRHDMRHHFTYLQALAGTGNLDKIQEYIQTAQSDLDAITPKRFCSNELINLLLSAYDTKAESEGISLLVQASIPAELPLSDTKLCAILSNALENALHASIETEEKFIQVQLAERNQTLLIQISNPFIGTVSFQNGLPVSTQAGHGFGTKNIAAIADSYHGQFQFFAKDEIFTVRVLLPLVET